MSIASRMVTYDLYRSTNTLDSYGVKSATPTKVASIQVSITKNNSAYDSAAPRYDTTSYIGITRYSGMAVGDILGIGTARYQVKVVGNRGSVYQPLLLEKIA